MTTEKTSLRISELDFESIKANLIEFMKNQSEFSDYDFEGSGMSVLMDLLAYNTHYMGYYLNMVGNEMFLDTAQLRPSIVSHAKHIDYVPGSATGAKATINLRVTPSGSEDNTATTLLLPKNSKFASLPYQGEVYTFSTTEARTTAKSNGSFLFSNVSITQGEPVSAVYTVSENRKEFPIPSANVDTDTIDVFVQQSSVNSSTEIFTMADDITEVLGNSAVYFLNEKDNDYSIQFGDNVIGKSVSNGNIITINYLDTSGAKANKVNAWASLANIGGYSGNVIVTSVSAAAGGAARETVEEIRYRAPRAYTAQNRAVTTNDYKTLLIKDYPSIESISVWSGDENDPPIYGKVFISLKPKENYTITTAEKLRIVNEIVANRAVLTVTPEIVDPDYEYLLMNITATYNPNLMNMSENQLKDLIRQSVIEYAEKELNKFNSIFVDSNVQNYIDRAHNSIIGSYINITTQKRVTITKNQNRSYSVDFQHRLHRGSIDDKLSVYPSLGIFDNQGIYRDIFIEDTPNSLTGVDFIEVLNPGTGYSSTPTITILGDGRGATAEAVVVGGRINRINVTNKGSDYSSASVVISGGGGFGASARITIQSKVGTLRSFYYTANGEKNILNSSVGTIDYISGVITLSPISIVSVPSNSRYDTNTITFNADPYQGVILPKRNSILSLDENDPASIQITLLPQIV